MNKFKISHVISWCKKHFFHTWNIVHGPASGPPLSSVGIWETIFFWNLTICLTECRLLTPQALGRLRVMGAQTWRVEDSSFSSRGFSVPSIHLPLTAYWLVIWHAHDMVKSYKVNNCRNWSQRIPTFRAKALRQERNAFWNKSSNQTRFYTKRSHAIKLANEMGETKNKQIND